MPFTGIVLDPVVGESYPEARIGWLVAEVDVRENHPHVESLKSNLVTNLAGRGIDDGNLAAQPDIAKWREVYSRMGAKPSKFRSSLEALARRVVKGQEMWRVSSVVDCYNCTSVLSFLAMGAHDTARVDGKIALRYGRAGERFLPLGKSGEEIEVLPKQVVYADDTKICCWLWNHRDTRLASVTAETREALFIVDSAFTPHTTSIEDGLALLAAHLREIGCSPLESAVVDSGI